MIIGLSAGDIFLGIRLLKDSYKALSSTRGSQKQYVDAVKQLETLEICLKLAQSKLSGLDADDSRSIVARAITECGKCIEDYQRDILSKYEKFFGSETEANARRKFVRSSRRFSGFTRSPRHFRERSLRMCRSSHWRAVLAHCEYSPFKVCDCGLTRPRPSTSSVHLSGQISAMPQLVASGGIPEHAPAQLEPEHRLGS